MKAESIARKYGTPSTVTVSIAGEAIPVPLWWALDHGLDSRRVINLQEGASATAVFDALTAGFWAVKRLWTLVEEHHDLRG